MKDELHSKEGRIIADLGPSGGALLLVTCLVHGNESAGEKAILRVLEQIGPDPAAFLQGRTVFLRGNLGAAASKKRLIDMDLNRVFPTEVALAVGLSGMFSELRERDELISLIRTLSKEHPQDQRYFADLHTTSSETLPYLSLPSSDDHSIAFARNFPLHLVTGFSRYVPGSIDRYLHEQGFTGFACEGGQHERSNSVTSMTALLWMMLEKTGCLVPDAQIADRSSLDQAHAVLDGFVVGSPEVFEMTYRHALDGTEDFVMKPGFANFHEVDAGQIIAKDKEGPIRSPDSGNLLMPLYQSAGSDGFFLVKKRAISISSRQA